MGTIIVKGLSVNASHGVYGYEKSEIHPFVFDAELEYDFSKAALYDELDGTVSYSKICSIIEKTATENCFDLIERLAFMSACAVMDETGAKKISLTCFKPEAPLKCKFENVGVRVELERNEVLLSIGSSIGDRKKYLDNAVERLGNICGVKVIKVSKYLESEPYGGVAKNRFLNGGVLLECYLDPFALLDEIHKIESENGRERLTHWADRTLDIDIVFFGDKIVNTSTLTIPHPDYSRRNFVLTPLKEIAPDFVCPLTNKKLKII